MPSESWQDFKASLIGFQQLSISACGLCLNGCNCCYGYQKHVFE
jgi:hypothetical protein